jgi:PRTRC genetic system protein C
MTTQDQQPFHKRVFEVEGHTFDDPGPDYTAEQVRRHLLQFFPSIAQATTEEKVVDGVLRVSFRKQVSRKGSVP